MSLIHVATDALGNVAPVGVGAPNLAMPVSGVDANGNLQRYNADGTPYQPTYQLASNITLAGSAATTPITAVTGGSYVFDARFGGTTPSLNLQALGADGVTWVNVGAALTAGGNVGVVIGQGASVRILNNTANSITALSASLT